MTDNIRADIDGIRALSTVFRTVADQVGWIDTAQVSAGAGDGFPGGAAIVDALEAAQATTRRTVSLISDRGWSTSDTIDRICENYENTDDYFAAELARAVPE